MAAARIAGCGLGDDQVAQGSGVSRGTLSRYLENRISRTGSADRFQLALHAYGNEWI
jgi:transcriptional regulator with XRE-family HTH domain